MHIQQPTSLQALELESVATIELTKLRRMISTLDLYRAVGRQQHPDIDHLQARAKILEADILSLRQIQAGVERAV